jgi:hypothetical protein
MTMPRERYNAVNMAREFLSDIMAGKYDDNPNALFYDARRCLKHYPGEYHMEKAREKAPEVFGEIDENKT